MPNETWKKILKRRCHLDRPKYLPNKKSKNEHYR